MTILSSAGFSSEKLLHFCESCFSVNKSEVKCAIITTACQYEKENNKWVIFTRDALIEHNFCNVDFVDLETCNTNDLYQYQLIVINGGNAYYLFHVMKNKQYEKIFMDLCKSNRIIIGISAGAFFLSEGIQYINEYDIITNNRKHKNTINLFDLNGINIYHGQIIPHYDYLIKNCPELEDKVKEIEKKNNIKILRINNNQNYINNGEKWEEI